MKERGEEEDKDEEGWKEEEDKEEEGCEEEEEKRLGGVGRQ